jgi:hypothetical protein
MRVLFLSKLSPHWGVKKWSKTTWNRGRRRKRRSKLRPHRIYFGKNARK